jgi:hypothetical protein
VLYSICLAPFRTAAYSAGDSSSVSPAFAVTSACQICCSSNAHWQPGCTSAAPAALAHGIMCTKCGLCAVCMYAWRFAVSLAAVVTIRNITCYCTCPARLLCGIGCTPARRSPGHYMFMPATHCFLCAKRHHLVGWYVGLQSALFKPHVCLAFYVRQQL